MEFAAGCGLLAAVETVPGVVVFLLKNLGRAVDGG